MNQNEFRQERMVAEEQAEFHQARGVNWAVVSLTIFIIIMIIGGLLFTMLPSGIMNRNNQNSSSGAPIDGR